MEIWKRWLSLTLSLALTLCLAPAVQAAGEESFAEFLIDGEEIDAPQLPLKLDVYRRNQAGEFHPSVRLNYLCQVNRVAGNSSFYIDAKEDGVWLTVDYLTDLNQDEVYELPDGQDEPIYDVADSTGQLAFVKGEGRQKLSAGERFTLTSRSLAFRGRIATADRSNPGGRTYLSNATWEDSPDPDTILYLITLYREGEDGTVQDMCFYLQLYDEVIRPSDVPADAWYCDAVEYALDKGILSGTGEDTFSPDNPVTRAQLAQILWRLGGAKSAADAGYADVPPDAWCYQAVSWCSQADLISGQGPDTFAPNASLTREQLALILYQYAGYAGKRPDSRRDLTIFQDNTRISPWAREAMEWAVSLGLVSGYSDNTLRPANGITRAELAAVMQRYGRNILKL